MLVVIIMISGSGSTSSLSNSSSSSSGSGSSSTRSSNTNSHSGTAIILGDPQKHSGAEYCVHGHLGRIRRPWTENALSYDSVPNTIHITM